MGSDLSNQIIQQVFGAFRGQGSEGIGSLNNAAALDPLRSESARGSGKLSFVKSIRLEPIRQTEFDERGTSSNVLISPVVFPVR